ncbi:anaerobic ribonucleoside-triphosphate reductase activating protein [Romboutsia sp.]|uniref:anaerobic ribonucleoside-triphosphate reductase activating protein n=1 Tax=Romboutsia sp. TaxID=1965302 RepID=UPI002C9DE578|nr:anaerobic ribonucleoside-triphosphate reductase activating protein [Romboutsia sp.]HSQ90239.1 anaerobic ribonucleoside-triphosphate reductase activating protein [Romboutsia sp.]
MKFSKIKDNDIANGLGIVMSLWTQGCPHHCKGCFNVETWDFEGGKEFSDNDLNYIIDNINKNNVKRNLSILGGEPLCPQNIDGVIMLCKEFKKVYPQKMIYVWTGYVIEDFDESQREILKYIDVLVDGKFEEDKKNLSIMLRGSSNQRVINVEKYLKHDTIVLYEA